MTIRSSGAPLTGSGVQSFLLEGWNETREPGGTLMAEAALTPHGAATETGV